MTATDPIPDDDTRYSAPETGHGTRGSSLGPDGIGRPEPGTYTSDDPAPVTDTDRTDEALPGTYDTGRPAHRAETYDTGSTAPLGETDDADEVRSHDIVEDAPGTGVIGTEDALLTDSEKIRARGIDDERDLVAPAVGTEDALLTDPEKVRARGIDQT